VFISVHLWLNGFSTTKGTKDHEEKPRNTRLSNAPLIPIKGSVFFSLYSTHNPRFSMGKLFTMKIMKGENIR